MRVMLKIACKYTKKKAYAGNIASFSPLNRTDFTICRPFLLYLRCFLGDI